MTNTGYLCIAPSPLSNKVMSFLICLHLKGGFMCLILGKNMGQLSDFHKTVHNMVLIIIALLKLQHILSLPDREQIHRFSNRDMCTEHSFQCFDCYLFRGWGILRKMIMTFHCWAILNFLNSPQCYKEPKRRGLSRK